MSLELSPRQCKTSIKYCIILLKYDNRKLWEKYNYRDYGIIGEPYFDINFKEVLYLTDTGRRWYGESISIRDKAVGKGLMAEGNPSAYRLQPSAKSQLHSTFDIISAAEKGSLPDKIMLTIHPQRWDNQLIPWIRELFWQNVKNIGKWILKERLRDLGTDGRRGR